jgi:hypothetical protein
VSVFGVLLVHLAMFASQNGDDQIDWQEFAAVIKHSLENAKKQLDKELEDAKKQGKSHSIHTT